GGGGGGGGVGGGRGVGGGGRRMACPLDGVADGSPRPAGEGGGGLGAWNSPHPQPLSPEGQGASGTEPQPSIVARARNKLTTYQVKTPTSSTAPIQCNNQKTIQEVLNPCRDGDHNAWVSQGNSSW